MRSPKGRLELTWMGKDMALIPTAHGHDLTAYRERTAGVRTMRDVGEHADEYNLSKGRRKDIRRADVQVWSMGSTAGGGLTWTWLGHELDVDAVTAAAGSLYNAFDALLTPILGDSHRSPTLASEARPSRCQRRAVRRVPAVVSTHGKGGRRPRCRCSPRTK